MKKSSRAAAVNVSRRQFLVGSAAVASGGLAVGLPFGLGEVQAQGSAGTATPAEVNAWVVIKPVDTCVIRIARSEMGQGTRTGLAQLVAEELECDWKKIATEYPTPGQSHARKRVWGNSPPAAVAVSGFRTTMYVVAVPPRGSC